MPAKRIPQLDILTGATSATDDKVVIFDADGNETKSITRQELGKGIVGDLPYTPSGGIAATTVPAAIAELDTEAAKSAALAATGGAALIGNTPAGTIAATTVQGAINEIVSDLAANSGSSLVGYTQGDTGADDRTVQAKLREFVSVEDFGAVGDGVADDTTALTNAIAAEVPLYFGDKTYKITAPIAQTLTKDVLWQGRGAKISYENASHTEYAIRLSDTTGVDIVINNLTIDGMKQANKVLELLNNTSNATSTNFVANELRVENAKRLNTFSGGEGVHIRGSFEDVTFNGGWIKDCELPTGQGTSGSIGISGITVTWYSDTSYVKRVTLNGILIEKAYSSDLSYQDDQDGIKYFAPTETSSGKIESNFVAMGGCRFVNCYGRSIKTQCRNTVVRDSQFERTEGLASGVGNGEIAAQTGSIVATANTFSYRNNNVPGACIGLNGQSDWKTGCSITDNEVSLESGMTLPVFALTFPATVTAPFSRIEVCRNKILGEVTRFVDFLCNSDKNYLTCEDNWVDEIAVGDTSERVLVYVKLSSSSPPNTANIFVKGNIYNGSNTAYLGRDGISGNSMFANWSGFGNFGFVQDITKRSNTADPLENIALAANITGFENQRARGMFGVQTKFITAGATETFSYRSAGSFFVINAGFNQNAYALFSASGATTLSILAGSEFSVGTTSNPGSGRFRVWNSATNEISVQNNDASGRVVSLFTFIPS